MAVSISLFNHKGGVSKTTTAFNLGWMVAKTGKRVMLVDCDPQCNLTGLILGYRKVEDAGKILGKKKGSVKPYNIRDGLSPAFESRPTPIEAVECVKVPGNDNLILLPGHIGLAEYEVTLGIAQELSGSLVTLRNLPGSLRYLIETTAHSENIDYVFIDMSPSLGPVNQNLLMTSEFFIVPLHPDYFSSMGIDSLSTVIPKWKAWSDQARKMPVLREAEYPFPDITPKFMGSVIQKFRPRGANAPSKAFRHWITELELGLADRLLPALEKSGMMLPLAAYESAGFTPNKPLLQMPDFNSLIARSQENQVPIYELTDKQLQQEGIVLERTKKSMREFRKLFTSAAAKVNKIADYARDHKLVSS